MDSFLVWEGRLWCQNSRFLFDKLIYLIKIGVFLVFMLWISEFALYLSLLLTTSRRRESIYCDWRGNILSLLNESVHESILLHLIIIMFPFLPKDIYTTRRVQYLNVLNEKTVIQYNYTHFKIWMLFLSTYKTFCRWQNIKFFFKCGYNWSCYHKVHV
jgi:hypothetical protein